MRLLKNPMPVPALPQAVRFLRKAWPQLWKFIAHLVLVLRVSRHRGHGVLVREFLTLPLLCVAPFLYSRRRRMAFLVQHNLMTAAQRPLERWALRTLRRMGFNFVVFEETSSWNEALGAGALGGWVKALPHPINDVDLRRVATPGVVTPGVATPSTADRTVGFVGNFRAEKSPWAALEDLTSYFARAEGPTCKTRWHLLVGCPDAAFRQRCAPFCETVDTTRREAYLAALARCDVVVLQFARDAYLYRTSGVVAEAIANRCLVIAPDYPIIASQVLQPAPAGVCYGAAHGVVEAMRAAERLIADTGLQSAFDAHLNTRGPRELSVALEELFAP